MTSDKDECTGIDVLACPKVLQEGLKKGWEFYSDIVAYEPYVEQGLNMFKKGAKMLKMFKSFASLHPKIATLLMFLPEGPSEELLFMKSAFAQGGDSIDILDGLNPSLNLSLNHFSIQCLPKRVLNLILNPSLNPSLKF